MNDLGETFREAWDCGGEPALASRAQKVADAGMPSAALYTGLESLLLQLRAAGADDEAEAGVMNVMDRVAGWCHGSRMIGGEKAAEPVR